MNRFLSGLIFLALGTGGPVTAAEFEEPLYQTAVTMPKGTFEAGLFRPLRWSIDDNLEAALHPALVWLMPHAELTVRWLSEDRLHLASRHRLAYPGLLLNGLAREGTGGLLPSDAQIPEAVLVTNGLLLTAELPSGPCLTARADVTVAPGSASKDMPILDFPFLYPRLAAMNTTATASLGFQVDGRLARGLTWSLSVDGHILPVVDGGNAVEQAGHVRWQMGRHVGLALAYRLSWAHYPVGTRFHALPLLDVLINW